MAACPDAITALLRGGGWRCTVRRSLAVSARRVRRAERYLDFGFRDVVLCDQCVPRR
jgi:hypothetical protein